MGLLLVVLCWAGLAGLFGCFCLIDHFSKDVQIETILQFCNSNHPSAVPEVQQYWRKASIKQLLKVNVQ